MNDKKFKNFKLYFLISSLLISSLTLTSCGASEEEVEDNQIYEDVEIEEEDDDKNDEAKDDEEEEAINEAYQDEESIKEEEKKDDEDVLYYERTESIYVKQLDDRTKQAFHEIKSAAVNGLNEVQLQTIITPKDLTRIFNILLIDTPEAIGLSNNYSYEVDSTGNVVKINLNYFLKDDVIKSFQKSRLAAIKNRQDMYTDEVTLKSEVTKEILEDFDTLGEDNSELIFEKFSFNEILVYQDEQERKEYEAIEDEDLIEEVQKHINIINGDVSAENDEILENIDYESYQAVLHSQYGPDSFQLPLLKQKLDILRSLGYEASIVAGEFIADELIPQNQPVDIFNFLTFDKTLKEKKEGNLVSVSADPYNYYFWMVIKIEDDYYIYDPGLDRIVNYYFLNNILNKEDLQGNIEPFVFEQENAEGLDQHLYTLVPDYLVSGTRLMYPNEDLLGLFPSSSSIRFANLRQSDEYVDKTGLTNLKAASDQFIDDILSDREDVNMYYKVFPDNESMHNFINFFKQEFDEKNEENKKLIKEYKLKELNSCNMFIIYDILK